MSGLYLREELLAPIREKVRAGREPWAAAYARLIEAANEALTQEPVCIRDNGGSPHFRQDAAYVEGQDGVRDGAANHASSRLGHVAGRRARDLALAWRFTGEARYADKALEQIHTWCINRSTYMMPDGMVVDAWTPGGRYGGDVVMFAAMKDLFLAGYLLRDYPGWNLRARAGVKRWVRDMVAPQRELMFYQGREMYNNWEDARLLYLAKAALFLDDADLLIYVFERWRHTLPMKMTETGELHRETMRTRSMTYTLASLDGTAEIAEIARQLGEDLYDLTIDGKNLKLAVDYAAHGLLHIDEWPHQLIRPLSEEFADRAARLGVFELAHARWGEKRYLDVIEAWGGRPVIAGHATLLHAI